MAGRPRTRAKREAVASRGRKRFDSVARAAILKRAEVVGAGVAAAEAGISAATLRTWRKRLADAPERELSSLPQEAGGESEGSRAERLRAEAEKARRSSARALDQADSLLTRGLASDARNASVAVGVFAERARELEEAARAEELHAVALGEAMGKLVIAAIERGFEGLGLPVPQTFVAELLRGWPAAVDEGIVDVARGDVRRAIAAEVRGELAAEAQAVRAVQRALPAGGEGDGGEDGDAGDVVGEVVLDVEMVEEEPEPELPEGVEVDEQGNRWREAFTDRDGVRHGRVPVVTQAVPLAREGPAARRGRFDFSHPGGW